MGASTAALVIAAQSEHEAREARCMAVQTKFDSHTATIAQSQEYADCVKFLYPDPLSASTVIVLKLWIAVVLVSAVVGGVRTSYGDVALGALEGVFFGVAIPAVIGLVGCGIAFIFIG